LLLHLPVLNSNNEEIQIPFYTLRDFDNTIPILYMLSDGSTSTRFTLNASNAANFGLRVVDSIGRVVSDSNRTVDVARFGKLAIPTAIAHDKLEARFTHPTIPHITLNQNLKLQILYEGGLLGIDIPISFLRPNAPLAAEMVEFTGKYLESHHVNQLTWTTISEINNDYFEIERSEGKSDFKTIGMVSGSNRPNQYTFIDDDVIAPKIYTYRLRQVDFDGTETLSENVSIKVTDNVQAKTHISPNPATDMVTLHIEGRADDEIIIQVFNMAGQKVVSDIDERMIDNSLLVEMNTSTLQKGIYNVMVQVNNEIFHHKLLIVD
jgi:hypothetical protein